MRVAAKWSATRSWEPMTTPSSTIAKATRQASAVVAARSDQW
ncbi:hypothetical protein [Rathayibacter oskolensis]